MRGWSRAEEQLAGRASRVAAADIARARRRIARGGDPLGEAFCALRPASVRRALGATYTPAEIVRAMVRWSSLGPPPQRVVDPGCGSGRFLVAAARRFAGAQLVGIELDPLAALLARAHLAAAGHAARAEVIVGDYRRTGTLPAIDARTLFLGNPPYVRHHAIAPRWKDWLARTAQARGLRASRLAGLHAYFFLATLECARAGDRGAFVTASEWLDVGYGSLVRELLVDRLGLASLQLVEPSALPFPDVMATAVVATFEVGTRPASVRARCVARTAALGDLARGRALGRERLARAPRWTPLLRGTARRASGRIELGELFRVHRGAATGANGVWVVPAGERDLPRAFLRPAVTRARELISCAPVLRDASALRSVVDLPDELDRLAPEVRRAAERFLARARRAGAERGYLARHRRPWWSLGLREPAPILCTYMARRPPVFVRNAAGARHLNVAHGLYPRTPMSDARIDGLVAYLNGAVSAGDGRTYAGGLTKFEPSEIARLLVPPPESAPAETR